MRYLILVTCLLILATEASAEVVTFPGAVAEGYSTVVAVKGDLELPEAKSGGTFPAVLILHGSAGIDGRGEFHGKGTQCGRDRYLRDLHVFSRQPTPWGEE